MVLRQRLIPRGSRILFVSPEVVANFRAISFNPLMKIAPQPSRLATVSRMRCGELAGFGNLFGVNIVEMYEFGTGQKYNTLYDLHWAGTLRVPRKSWLVLIVLLRRLYVLWLVMPKRVALLLLFRMISTLSVRIRSVSMADSKRDVSFSMLAPLSVA
jgi:hypothetical protein